MQKGDERREGKERTGGGETRPQRGGEGGTTRLGMEDGDNTEVPATGGPASDERTPSGETRDLPEHP